VISCIFSSTHLCALSVRMIPCSSNDACQMCSAGILFNMTSRACIRLYIHSHALKPYFCLLTDDNMVELPPLRFVRETSRSDKVSMEAVVIDIDEQDLKDADMAR